MFLLQPVACMECAHIGVYQQQNFILQIFKYQKYLRRFNINAYRFSTPLKPEENSPLSTCFVAEFSTSSAILILQY